MKAKREWKTQTVALTRNYNNCMALPYLENALNSLQQEHWNILSVVPLGADTAAVIIAWK